MPDIRAITILPPPSAPSVQQPQGSTGTGTQGTTSLAGLQPGTVLSGFIVNRDASGNPVLRTASGDINFSSNFFLNIGSEVSIRVENSAAGTLAHILTVNGQPPEIATAQSAFSQEPSVIVSDTLSTLANQTQEAAPAAEIQPPEPIPTPTITLTGTLVSQPQSPPDNATPLPTGTQVTIKVTGVTQAPSTIPDEIIAASPAPAATTNEPTSAASYTTYARAAGTPAPSTATITSSPQQITAPQPAIPETEVATTNTLPASPALPSPPVSNTIAPTISNAAATAAASQTNASTTATVIGNSASGESSLQTQLGVIRLQPGVTLPTGSTVTFEVTDTTLPAAQATTAIAAASLPAPLTELAQQWTSLQQIFSLLSGRDNNSSFDTIQATMPWVTPSPNAATPAAATPQNIPAGLALFISALRGGNFSNWLGDSNVRWLQDQGHDALVKKADGEFTMLARQYTEAQPQHWQPLFFPVAVGTELQQARLFVKRDRKQGSNDPQGKKEDDTRFVVEVDLTQLGEMQMDGFVRRRDQNIQFDLVIRSLTPLSDEIQKDIMQIYNNTGELTGYKGSVAFQTVKDFPVNPMEEIVGRANAVVV